MGKKILRLCICAATVALHIVLELYCTLRLGNELKVSFSTLPFVIVALLYGPVDGGVTGLVGTFISQLLTYGITATTPIWIIPGAVQGLVAGLVYIAFKRKNKFWPITISVCVSCIMLVILNWVASYLDGVVIFKYWVIEYLIALIPIRLLVGVALCVAYSAVSFPIVKALRKAGLARTE